MKINYFSVIVFTLMILLAVSGCNKTPAATSPAITDTQAIVPISVGSLPTNGTEAADDIVITPGGYAYRANMHQQGVPDKWPPIETTETKLVNGSDAIFIRYRKNVVTQAGEIRNNLLNVRRENSPFENQPIQLYTIGAQQDLKLFQRAGAGLPGVISTLLLVEIPQNFSSGSYNFSIGIEIEGKDYGTLPCRLQVTE